MSLREHQHLSYAELIDELQALVISKSTGTMFIRTELDHSVRIALQNGRIVSYNYRLHQREKATSLIRRIQSGEYSFRQDMTCIAAGESLPANFDFFKELATAPDLDDDFVSSKPGKLAGAASFAPLTVRQDTSPGPTDLRLRGSELFETVVHELTFYLGPVARMVALEYEKELRFATSGEQVRTLMFRLGQEIGDTRHASEFEIRILSLVSNWECPSDS
ncbi:hypothetical protein [Rhodoferax sp.]|uniref:hypothetical protein n=1 Tax=Rhodoferax sp. TaxID=50421 RepID=UPI00374D6C06